MIGRTANFNALPVVNCGNIVFPFYCMYHDVCTKFVSDWSVFSNQFTTVTGNSTTDRNWGQSSFKYYHSAKTVVGVVCCFKT